MSMALSSPIFHGHAPGIGALALEPLQVEVHARTVHPWLASDHARFWAMQWMSLADVQTFYTDMAASHDATAYVGSHEGQAAFLVETYNPAADPIGRHYHVRAGDQGMHILIAAAERPIAGFSQAVFSFVMDFLFSDAAVERVIVEPDVENDKIHTLNRRAGFVYQKRVTLAEKTAALAFCTRADYQAARVSAAPESRQARAGS